MAFRNQRIDVVFRPGQLQQSLTRLRSFHVSSYRHFVHAKSIRFAPLLFIDPAEVVTDHAGGTNHPSALHMFSRLLQFSLPNLNPTPRIPVS